LEAEYNYGKEEDFKGKTDFSEMDFAEIWGIRMVGANGENSRFSEAKRISPKWISPKSGGVALGN